RREPSRCHCCSRVRALPHRLKRASARYRSSHPTWSYLALAEAAFVLRSGKWVHAVPESALPLESAPRSGFAEALPGSGFAEALPRLGFVEVLRLAASHSELREAPEALVAELPAEPG